MIDEVAIIGGRGFRTLRLWYAVVRAGREILDMVAPERFKRPTCLVVLLAVERPSA